MILFVKTCPGSKCNVRKMTLVKKEKRQKAVESYK
jgi:hypothetical protein